MSAIRVLPGGPFVQSSGALDGFEIETELSVHRAEWRGGSPKSKRRLRPRRIVRKAQHWSGRSSDSAHPEALTGRKQPCGCSPAIGMFLTMVSIGFAIPIMFTYPWSKASCSRLADRGSSVCA